MLFSDHPRTHYRNAPAHEVICQLRFPSILTINSVEPADFQEAIRAEFPQYARRQDAAPPRITGLGSPNPKVEQQPPVTNHNFVSEDNQWKLNLTKDFIALSTLHYPGGGGVCPPAGQAAGRLYPAVQARLFPAGGPAVCEYLLPCPAGAGGCPLGGAVLSCLHRSHAGGGAPGGPLSQLRL